MSNYRVAVVGIGFFGKLHLSVLSKLSNVTVVAVVDTDRKAWNEVKDEYPDVNYFENIDELLLEENINVVHITTDESSHHSLAVKALKNDKHVFIEKPIATESKHAIEIFELAKEKELTIGIGHLLRYEMRHQKIKKQLENNEIGKIESITLRRNFKREMIERYGRINAYITAMVHDIDLVQYFTNDKVTEFDGYQDLPIYSSYKFNNALLKTQSGCICNLENLWLLPNDYPYGMEFEVILYGETGMIRSRTQPYIEMYKKDGVEYPDVILDEALEKELKIFVDCVVGRTNKGFLTPTVEAAIHTVEVAEKLIQYSPKMSLKKL